MPSPSFFPPSARGFTLIEALVVVAIVALMAAVGLPAFRSLMEKNAVANEIQEFVGSANLARSESMKRGHNVVMCQSDTAGSSDSPTCNTATEWKGGWMVFSDVNNDGSFSTSDGDVLLQVRGNFPSSGGITQSAAANLVFRPNGLMTSGASSVVFAAASGDANLKRRVCLTLGGRTRIIDDPTTTCE